MRKEKYAVWGEYGGTFTNLADAKKCAKYASTTKEHDFESSIELLEDGCTYIDYQNGKCIRDGWTIKKSTKKEKQVPKMSTYYFA